MSGMKRAPIEPLPPRQYARPPRMAPNSAPALSRDLSENFASDQFASNDSTPVFLAERFAGEFESEANGTARPRPHAMPSQPDANRQAGAEPPHREINRNLLTGLLATAIVLPGSLICFVAFVWLTTPRQTSEAISQVPAAAPQAASNVSKPPAVSATPQGPGNAPGSTAAAPALTTVPVLHLVPNQPAPFKIAIDGTDAVPPRSALAISGLPEGAVFSAGRPFGEGEWNLRPDEIADLTVTVPAAAAAAASSAAPVADDLTVRLISPAGHVLAQSKTALMIAAPEAPAGNQADDKLNDLIDQGNKMVSLGDIASARGYFRQAANGGNAQAALSMAVTYDPDFIVRFPAQTAKADVDKLADWRERARQLGVQDVQSAFDGVETSLLSVAPPTDAASPAADSQKPKIASKTKSKAMHQAKAAHKAKPYPVDQSGGSLGLVTADVKLHEGPGNKAKAVGIMQKGTAVRIIGEKEGWLHVVASKTKTSGWIYKRFVKRGAAG